MNAPRNVKIVVFPNIMKTLLAGFNLVAEHLYLLLFPVVFDLLVWLGPRFSAYQLFEKNAASLLHSVRGSVPASMMPQFNNMSMTMLDVVKQWNPMMALHTLSGSLPTLLSSGTESTGPLTAFQTIPITSPWVLIGMTAGLSLGGFLIGCFYYTIIAQKTMLEPFRLTWKEFGKRVGNMLLYSILLVVACFILMIPFSCIATFALLIAPGLFQVFLFLFLFGLAWLIVPLFFILEGVFLGLDIFKAIHLSLRLGKWFYIPTSLFIGAYIVIGFGLNIIWTIPAYNSWLLLIGIVGHAFIQTGLIASSLILYQTYIKWILENEELITKGKLPNDTK